MSDSNYLDPFRTANGSTTPDGQRQAGQWEQQQNFTPAPQQSYENSEAYLQRINSGNNS